MENGINTVHLSYIRERTGHALIGARQWIPAGHIDDPVKSLVMGLPADLVSAPRGSWPSTWRGRVADGVRSTSWRGRGVRQLHRTAGVLEGHGQGYVLRVPSNFHLTLARGATVTCAEAVRVLLTGTRRWEVRSAGKGSKGDRWYGWAWLATASPRHHLLVRRHIKTGELAFHYCFVPERPGSHLAAAGPRRRAALAGGGRFPVGKDCFGLDESQVRLYTAIARHTGWSWSPWPSAPSPPPSCATAPIPRHLRRSTLTSPRHQTRG